MAQTKNARYRVHNGVDFETIHLETSAKQVKMADGSTVENKLMLHLADYEAHKKLNGLIEQGASINGRYERYANGKQECWGSTIVNASIVDAWGVLYRSTIDTRTFPAAFTKIESINADVVARADSSYTPALIAIQEKTNLKFEFFLVRPSHTGSANYEIHYHAIGRWK